MTKDELIEQMLQLAREFADEADRMAIKARAQDEEVERARLQGKSATYVTAQIKVGQLATRARKARG